MTALDPRLDRITRGTTQSPAGLMLMAERGDLLLVKWPGGPCGGTGSKEWWPSWVAVHNMASDHQGDLSAGVTVWENKTQGRLTQKRGYALIERFEAGEFDKTVQ